MIKLILRVLTWTHSCWRTIAYASIGISRWLLSIERKLDKLIKLIQSEEKGG